MGVKRPILIIDDDEETLELISTLFRRAGYEVDTATTSMEALEKCSENFYSLLLVDLVLPDSDGLQLIKKIYDTDPRIRKVMITGYPSIQNAVQALNLGVDAYLIKPLNVSELLQVVEEQMDKYKKELAEKYPVLKNYDDEA
jgi:DNA-binding NtrC family response regulator